MASDTAADVTPPSYANIDDDKRSEIVRELQISYTKEVETLANYLANSIHLDGILAAAVKESLESDLIEELDHAKQLARRIKILGGTVPGSLALKWDQATMQPPANPIDVASVIRGVIEAETHAVNQYQKLIEITDGLDVVTQDLCIKLKGDEEEHRREFEGFLREYNTMAALSTSSP